MVYHRHKNSDEEVKIDVVTHKERDKSNIVHAKVETDYGTANVNHSFPKGQGWSEKLNGTEKFLLKLKDIALRELKTADSTEEECKCMEDMKMSEKQVC